MKRVSRPLVLLAILAAAAGSRSWTGRARQAPQPAERPQAARQAFTVRVSFGRDKREQERWSGTVAVENVEIAECRSWRFNPRDRLQLHEFELDTFNPRARGPIEKGLEIRGRAAPGGRLVVTTNRGPIALPPLELAAGEEREFLGGAARVTGLLDVAKLGDNFRDDDYPSIAVADNSTAWAVWQSYSSGADEVRLSKHDSGWRTFTSVPGGSGDVWRPQVALDGERRPWVVWSQQSGGNFDLYARALDPKADAWQELIRLSTDPEPDIDHHLIADAKGNLWVVWQGFRGGNSDIFLRHYDGTRWSPEIPVTTHPANDWEPRIAVDDRGRAAIVWDTYRNGSYDVYMRTFEGGKLGPEIAVAATPRFEAHAAVAIDSARRIWVAWDEAGANWGKDTGFTTDPLWRDHPLERFGAWTVKAAAPGTVLYDTRKVNLTVFDGERRLSPAGELGPALADAGITAHDYPQLCADPRSGRVALTFHRWGFDGEFTAGLETRQIGFWSQAVAFYQGNHWSPVWTMPASEGRPSMRSAAAFAPDGSLWVVWPTDGRQFQLPYHPVAGSVHATRVPPPSAPGAPALRAWQSPPESAAAPVHPREADDLRAIRSYRTFVHGVENRIVRGDFHRHTEFSEDNGGLRDGSLFDLYRYMIDTAALDFGAVTDHFGGGNYEYWWWLVQKSCDLYHLPRLFTTFYGYERSVQYPGGHRNVVHTRRGVPVVPFFTEPGAMGLRSPVAAPPNRLLQDDTKLLYEALRRSGGISIAHTTGSGAGTDWRDNDPAVEPAVEIFQGARVSYEHPGAPRAAASPEEFRDFREPGFVWNAYRKGYRLGTIASSDHWSTHISYALVYTEQPGREAILDGIKKRHTYGATDNIVLDYSMGEHFMGEEFTASVLPALRVRVLGTAPVARIDVIKDERVVYTSTPKQQDVSFSYTDQSPAAGTSYYYVRVVQENSEMAWGSPIWVTYRP
jgi:hypothetical protein